MTTNPESRCTGCGADVRWRFLPSGKRMILNHEPYQGSIDHGCYVIESKSRCRPADPLFDQGKTTYMNHWATCDDAHLFRKSPAGKRGGS